MCVLVLAASMVFITQSSGFSAREKPTFIERWLAQSARSAALPTGVKSRLNPVAKTDEAIEEGRHHWADHCALCHANDGSGDTAMGKNSYPPAPDMRLAETQQMTDGELFFIIQNGIRMSGMPAWGSGSPRDEQDSWKLVHFIRHLPAVTPDEKRAMEKLNPKSPDDLREEQEEENFLRGEDGNESQTDHQHHH